MHIYNYSTLLMFLQLLRHPRCAALSTSIGPQPHMCDGLGNSSVMIQVWYKGFKGQGKHSDGGVGHSQRTSETRQNTILL